MKHYTQNRQIIMRLLSDVWDDYGYPPYRAWDLHDMIKTIVQYRFEGYEQINKVPSMSQVHRTLRDLVKAGLIVGKKYKEKSSRDNQLPRWVTRTSL
jgi:hypothetical protein